ncbi:GIY-YIG nuclease family protein [bacterium]|nr:GIY-YIG nuclease family protein [bacterium]
MKQQPGVYILQSSKNGRYYIGSTNKINRRLKEHNTGKVKSTRFIRPLKLKVFLPCNTLEEARRAEYRLKKYKRKDIIESVIQRKMFPWKHRKDYILSSFRRV